MDRVPVPIAIKREVLVEAGHRCAIPTCRATTTEIAHIVPWAETQDNSFQNLIALCPNCHTRYDLRGEIDRRSMVMYKRNLSLLNNRYGEFERRLFSVLSKTPLDEESRVFVVGAGGDISLANAVMDGLFEDKHVQGIGLDISSNGRLIKNFPLSFTYWVTDKGVEFIRKYASGTDIS